LAIQALNEIKSAEEKANEIVKKAVSEKTQIIKNAEVKALEQYKTLLNEKRAVANEIIVTAVEKAKENSKPILERGESEKNAILNVPEEKIQGAVNLVMERIVNINGNS
jgi:V/A-type H+-transporting ATPase subunit G/H